MTAITATLSVEPCFAKRDDALSYARGLYSLNWRPDAVCHDESGAELTEEDAVQRMANWITVPPNR